MGAESVILVWHNSSIIPPAKHNFEHNTLVSWVMPESIILCFSSIIRQILCIYPWMHSRRTCFHVTSNVWVSGVKLSSFPAQPWSSAQTWVKGKMILVNKKGRNYQKGIPLSTIWGVEWKNLGRIILSQKLGENLGAVSKVIKHYTSQLPGKNLKVWHLKLRCLTSFENMFHQFSNKS